MFGNKTKLAAVLGAAFAAALTLGLPDRAAAAPPPGMRWSDHAWGSPSRPPTDLKGYGLQQWMNSHRGAAPTPRVGPFYGYPRAYGYAPPVAYVPAPAVMVQQPVPGQGMPAHCGSCR